MGGGVGGGGGGGGEEGKMRWVIRRGVPLFSAQEGQFVTLTFFKIAAKLPRFDPSA